MALQYRHRPLGDSWPGPRTRSPGKSPFRGANWGGTLGLLEHELRQLGAKDVVLAVSIDGHWIRNDGGIRADARVRDPGVILEFRKGPDLLSFPCDRFDWWQENVRAIALALEALRKVDRYGVRSGRQYEGFKALPGAGGTSTTLSAEVAAEIVATHAQEGFEPGDILGTRDAARTALRSAMASTHPDRHAGDSQAFLRVQDARQVLTAHHGGSL